MLYGDTWYSNARKEKWNDNERRIWDIVIGSASPTYIHPITKLPLLTFSFCFWHQPTNQTMSNLVDITSDNQFSSLISKKDAVIVLDFWAPWAEPCKQMNDVIAELAGKFSSLQFLKVTWQPSLAIAMGMIWLLTIDRSRELCWHFWRVRDCSCAHCYCVEGR